MYLNLRARYVQWALLLLAIFLVIFARAPSVLTLPSLQVEDGAYVFAHFYQHREIEQLFRVKDGYIHLIANIIGYISVRLPTTAIPYGLTWLPLLITLTTYSVFFSERYQRALPSGTARAVVCVLFAIAPLSQFHLLSHTDYSHWNTLVLLIFMAAMPLPAGRISAASYWLVQNLLVWSQPLTIVVLPFQVLFLVKDKSKRKLYAFTVANLVLHQFLGVESAQIFANLGPVGVGLKIAESVALTLGIVSRTAFRSAFGHHLFIWADQNMWFLLVYWSGFLSVMTAIAFWKRPSSRPLILTVLYLIFGVTFLSVLGRGHEAAENIGYSPRYVYVQSLSFLVLFVLLAHGAMQSASRANQSSSGRRQLISAPALVNMLVTSSRATAVLLFMVLHYFLLNTQYGHYFITNTVKEGSPVLGGSPYLYRYPENGEVVRKFFQELAAAEEKNDGRGGFRLVATKKDDWPIEVDTRSAAERGTIEQVPEERK